MFSEIRDKDELNELVSKERELSLVPSVSNGDTMYVVCEFKVGEEYELESERNLANKSDAIRYFENLKKGERLFGVFDLVLFEAVLKHSKVSRREPTTRSSNGTIKVHAKGDKTVGTVDNVDIIGRCVVQKNSLEDYKTEEYRSS